MTVHVVQLNNRFTAAGEALAKPAGHTLARRLVLAAIEGDPRTVADVARAMNLARQRRDALHIIEPAQHEWANAMGAEIGEQDLERAGAILSRVKDVAK